MTNLPVAYGAGYREAFDQLVEQLYPKLHELPRIQVTKRHPEETLDTTALVNEAYCKLAASGEQHWHDRNHFYAARATTMRHLLVDNARRRLRNKRGGGNAP